MFVYYFLNFYEENFCHSFGFLGARRKRIWRIQIFDRMKTKHTRKRKAKYLGDKNYFGAQYS